MDATTYKAWWPLHTKRAQGEALTPEEQAVYEAGREQMEAEEILQEDVAALRHIRAEIQKMEADRNALSEERRALRERIALPESHRAAETKQAPKHCGVVIS